MANPSIHTAVLGTLIVVGLTTPAYAYLDPGTGSIMLQALIGAIAGGLVAGRLYWDKIKSFFSKNGDDGPGAGPVEENHN